MFQGTQEMIRMNIGQEATNKFFAQSQYIVDLGSNDYINNFLLPLYADSWTYNGETFTNYVVTSFEGQLRESTNKLSRMFNKKSLNLNKTFSRTLPNATFKFGDAYDVFQDLIDNQETYGFSNSNDPCCKIAKIRPTLTCTPLSSLCKDRSKYVFWDEYHPTDRANELIANAVLSKLGLGKPDNETNKS
ncbi:GDSL esterase/lipase [Platanthera guangdongensis]|uniref:GDSL esterase/lipase n=1 Tax=Platanthera guangdongensis TaxID=2320717 RepID=A0ABR2M2A9_9ASPA